MRTHAMVGADAASLVFMQQYNMVGMSEGGGSGSFAVAHDLACTMGQFCVEVDLPRAAPHDVLCSVAAAAQAGLWLLALNAERACTRALCSGATLTFAM
jgi:hypothetical protein